MTTTIEFGKVVSLIVTPFRIIPDANYLSTVPIVEVQHFGADENTAGWGVYTRHENGGMVKWLADFNHPMDAVEFALEEIDAKFPDAFIERSAWVSKEDIDKSKPYLKILRRPADVQFPYAVVTVVPNGHPSTRSVMAPTEANAVALAINLAKKDNTPIAPYRWQK